MDFGARFWLVSCMVLWNKLLSEATVVHPPGPIRASPGETVNFTWTSNEIILETTWGIRSGSGLADPQFIFVSSLSENPVINPSLSADLKRRIHYTGDLTAGHAWFALSNVKVSDSNTYICIIHEESSSPQSYYLELIVYVVASSTQSPTVVTSDPTTTYEPPKTAPTTTQFPATGQTTNSSATPNPDLSSSTSGLNKVQMTGIAITLAITNFLLTHSAL